MPRRRHSSPLALVNPSSQNQQVVPEVGTVKSPKVKIRTRTVREDVGPVPNLFVLCAADPELVARLKRLTDLQGNPLFDPFGNLRPIDSADGCAVSEETCEVADDITTHEELTENLTAVG